MSYTANAVYPTKREFGEYEDNINVRSVILDKNIYFHKIKPDTVLVMVIIVNKRNIDDVKWVSFVALSLCRAYFMLNSKKGSDSGAYFFFMITHQRQ